MSRFELTTKQQAIFAEFDHTSVAGGYFDGDDNDVACALSTIARKVLAETGDMRRAFDIETAAPEGFFNASWEEYQKVFGVRYQALRPDGVPISFKLHESRQDAFSDIEGFVYDCRDAGYFKGPGYKIPVGELKALCHIAEVPRTPVFVEVTRMPATMLEGLHNSVQGIINACKEPMDGRNGAVLQGIDLLNDIPAADRKADPYGLQRTAGVSPASAYAIEEYRVMHKACYAYIHGLVTAGAVRESCDFGQLQMPSTMLDAIRNKVRFVTNAAVAGDRATAISHAVQLRDAVPAFGSTADPYAMATPIVAEAKRTGRRK